MTKSRILVHVMGWCVAAGVAFWILSPIDESGMTKAATGNAAIVRQIRAIAEAENKYRDAHAGRYSNTLIELQGVDLNSATHRISYFPVTSKTNGHVEHFSIVANPIELEGPYSARGYMYFYLDDSGVLRFERDRPASPSSPQV